jgi:hypothetical protein
MTLKRTVVCTVLGAGILAAAAVPAGADAPNTSQGQNGKADVVFLGGSDTTFEVEGRIATLWNQSPGCQTNNTYSAGSTDSKYYPVNSPSADTNFAECDHTLAANQAGGASSTKLNYDHDMATNIYPTGSTAGIGAMLGGFWQVARSSRVLTSGELGTGTALGFAKDGVAIDTFGTKVPNVHGFTKTMLANIYSCAGGETFTSPGGSSLPVTRSGLYSYDDLFHDGDPTLIHPYGIQTSSGTYATFKNWVGVDPSPTPANAKCVEPLGNPAPVLTTSYPFENNAVPVLTDAAKKGEDASGVLWWSSVGVFNTYSFKRDGAAFWPINTNQADTGNGVTPDTGNITDNSYDITRFLYEGVAQTTLKVSAGNAANQPLLVTSTSSNPQDLAAKDFAEFHCQPSSYFTGAPVNPYTGNGYFSELGTAISSEGFQRVPAAERNFGACIANA